MLKKLVVLLLLISGGVGVADIYKWVAPNGSVHYGEHPVNGAELLQLPAWIPPTLPPALSAPAVAPAEAKDLRDIKYDAISIQKPHSGEYVREQGDGIEVVINVQPGLRIDQGHVVRLLVDGMPQGSCATELTQRLTGVPRGRHRVAAQVLNAEGSVLIESRSVSFFYQVPSHYFTAPYFRYRKPGEPGITFQPPADESRFRRAPNVPPGLLEPPPPTDPERAYAPYPPAYQAPPASYAPSAPSYQAPPASYKPAN